jgi:L-ascorbate metabolism protein UlaG (beta-lactamase superfamily)
MEIIYLGHAAFRIKGKTATVVTDPYAPEHVGLKFPKHITADVVTVSEDHPDHNAIHQIEGAAYVVNGPGEYEIKGVGVIGHKSGKNTMYRIEIDGLSIVHLGDLDHTLSVAEVDSLDGVDILMVPVGGPAAVPVINEIEPSVVIPMHTDGGVATIKDFLKEIGKEDIVPQPKFTVTKDKLPEQMQVVILE